MSATTINGGGLRGGAFQFAGPFQASTWHLTRRGRLMTTLLTGLVLMLTGLIWFGTTVVSVSTAEANAGAVVQVVVPPGGSDAAAVLPRSDYALIEHTVVPGDTVWGLAQSVAGEGDPRAAVSRIQKLNSFVSGELQVGEVVLLPVVE